MVKLPPKDAYKADILSISPLPEAIALTRANYSKCQLLKLLIDLSFYQLL